MLQCETSDRSDRAEARRRRLLDTARALFTEHGFHQTGMAQIADASGIKVGQIYRDFASKEAIIAAIAEADVTAFLEEDLLAQAVAANDLEAVRAWMRRFGGCEAPFEKCRMISEVVAEAGRNPRVAELYQAIDGRVRASLAAAIGALTGAAAEEPRVACLAEFILAIGTGLKTRRIINPQMPIDALAAMLSSFLERQVGELTRAPCAPAEAA